MEGKYYLETARGTGSGNGAITEAGNLSMNTHIHILEPMTCYFRIRHDRCVEESLVNLIEVTAREIYDAEHRHFVMFFDERCTRCRARSRSATTSRDHGC